MKALHAGSGKIDVASDCIGLAALFQKYAAQARAADVRDRLWTLVKQGHDAPWRACAFLYGPDEIDAKVPALQARAATTSKRAEKAKAGAPAEG